MGDFVVTRSDGKLVGHQGPKCRYSIRDGVLTVFDGKGGGISIPLPAGANFSTGKRKTSTRPRASQGAWAKLSKRARKLQMVCNGICVLLGVSHFSGLCASGSHAHWQTDELAFRTYA